MLFKGLPLCGVSALCRMDCAFQVVELPRTAGWGWGRGCRRPPAPARFADQRSSDPGRALVTDRSECGGLSLSALKTVDMPFAAALPRTWARDPLYTTAGHLSHRDGRSEEPRSEICLCEHGEKISLGLLTSLCPALSWDPREQNTKMRLRLSW